MTTKCSCNEEFGDILLNVGRSYYAVCTKCSHFWWAGDNLFSSWLDQTQEHWDENANRLALMTKCNCSSDYTAETQWQPAPDDNYIEF